MLPRRPNPRRSAVQNDRSRQDFAGDSYMSQKMSRQAYARHYGPTVGDRIRLGDTELFIEIEKDHAVYGEEVVFGGGKVIRDGQGQSPLYDPKSPPHLDG